eukprot:8161307-Alexandrium_andersonii.AAC.1
MSGLRSSSASIGEGSSGWTGSGRGPSRTWTRPTCPTPRCLTLLPHLASAQSGPPDRGSPARLWRRVCPSPAEHQFHRGGGRPRLP